MNKIKLIVDSTADLLDEEIQEYQLDVIPLTVNIDGIDYENINNTEYIKRMKTANSFSTSQPATGKIIETYEKWTKLGYEIISFHISDTLSGTYNTAKMIAEDYKNVHVVNTKTTSRGIVYFVRDCIKYIQENKSINEILKAFEEKTNKILTYVTIDNLDNLVKGGRLKKSSGLIGGLLNIKILTKLEQDGLITLDKVRGKKKLVQSLMDNISLDTENYKIKTIELAHTLSEEYLTLIKEAIEDKLNYVIDDKYTLVTSPVISTHTGEGAVGILIELE